MLIYVFLINVVNYMHGCWKYNNSFLGAFTKLRKATLSFLSVCLPVCSCVCSSFCPSVRSYVCPSVCLSVCLCINPAAATRLPYNGFSWNLILVYFSKICRENSSFIKIWQELRILHTRTNIQGVSRLVDITPGGDFLGLCDQKVHINMCPILDG